jgi:FkbM family methyltransferase
MRIWGKGKAIIMGSLVLGKAYARWLRFWYIRMPLPYELRRLLASLFPRPRSCQVSIGEFQMALDPGDLLQANILLDGVWALAFSRWWAYLVSRAQVIVDAGAHCGYFSLLARQYAPDQAAIYAFEPNPHMQAQFERNVALNGFERIHLVPQALSDCAGTLTLYVRDRIEPGATSRHRAAYFDRVLDVPAIPLDTFLDEQGIDRVDVVKIDVEGAEGSVLDGMRAGLEAGRYGALALELHPAHLSPDQIDSILADLRVAGFTLFAMEEDAARRLEDDAGPVEELVALHAAVLPAFNLADGGSRLLLPDALAVQLGG